MHVQIDILTGAVKSLIINKMSHKRRRIADGRTTTATTTDTDT